jgi:hypothetical protein
MLSWVVFDLLYPRQSVLFSIAIDAQNCPPPANPFRIRRSEKQPRNSFRIRTYEFTALKVLRNPH